MKSRTDYHTKSRNLGYFLSEQPEMILRIPYYQRGYSWREKEVHAFFEDLCEQIQYYTTTQNLVRYYFGTITTICKGIGTNGIKICDLVDGQQRITTSIILLTCVRDIFNEVDLKDLSDGVGKKLLNRTSDINDRYKLILAKTDNEFFHDVILDNLSSNKTAELEKISKSAHKLKTHRNLGGAYLALRKAIKCELQKIDGSTDNEKYKITSVNEQQKKLLNELVSNLTMGFIVSHLSVGEEGLTYQLFNRMNNRGIGLADADLAKDLILSKIYRENLSKIAVISIEDAIDKWGRMAEKMLNDKVIIDNYIHHYLVTFHSNKKDKNGQTVFNFIRKKETLDELEKILDQKTIDGKQEMLAGRLLKNLYKKFNDYEKIYLNLDHPEMGANAKDNIAWINKLGTTIVYPVLMAGLEKYPDYFEELSDIVLKWFFKAKTIAKQNPSILEEELAKITHIMMEDNKPFKQIKGEFLNSKNNVPEDDLAKFILHRPLGSIVAKYLLTKIIDYKQQIKITNAQFDGIVLEHIMPNTINQINKKFIDAETHEESTWSGYIYEIHDNMNKEKFTTLHKNYKNCLGNLTLVHRGKNLKLGIRPFHKKCEIYKNSSIQITNQIPKKYKKWDEAAIKKRNNELIDVVKDALTI